MDLKKICWFLFILRIWKGFTDLNFFWWIWKRFDDFLLCCGFEKDFSISIFFMDLKKIYGFDFFSWIWKRVGNFYLFCRFEKDLLIIDFFCRSEKDYSIWNVFRFERLGFVFIWLGFIYSKHSCGYEKYLPNWKRVVDLKNICWFGKHILWMTLLDHRTFRISRPIPFFFVPVLKSPMTIKFSYLKRGLA